MRRAASARRDSRNRWQSPSIRSCRSGTTARSPANHEIGNLFPARSLVDLHPLAVGSETRLGPVSVTAAVPAKLPDIRAVEHDTVVSVPLRRPAHPVGGA